METTVTERSDRGRTDFLYCCGAITEVLKFGPAHLNHETKVLFLVIPGNPGVVGFYGTFMQTLRASTGSRHPVWCVSHAGHCEPPGSMDLVQDRSSAGQGDVFGFQAQIEHKLAFLRKHVPRQTSLVLVGHSIGCFIVLDMMRRNPELQVMKAVLLFPTIERMATTPQGRVMTPVLCQLRYAAYLPIFLLSLLPRGLQEALVRLAFCRIPALDRSVVAPAVGLLSGDCAANAMYMGGQEMKSVFERDNVTIKNNLEKLVFFYGAEDHWCPVDFYHEMKRDFPDGDIRLLEKGFRHAFVLDTAKDVARMVAQCLPEYLST